MIEQFDSSLRSVSEAYVRLALIKDHPISDLARAFHWGIPAGQLARAEPYKTLRPDGRIHGVPFELPTDSHLAIGAEGQCTFESNAKELMIDGIYFPGHQYGKELFEKIDVAYQSVDWRSLPWDKLAFNAAAFLSFFCVTHAFCDGNGRVSVCVAKHIIEKYSDRELSLDVLMYDNDSLKAALALCSHALLPMEENPHEQLLRQTEAYRVIAIKDYFFCISLMRDYLRRYKESISQSIDDFSTSGTFSKSYVTEAIHNLSTVLKRASAS